MSMQNRLPMPPKNNIISGNNYINQIIAYAKNKLLRKRKNRGLFKNEKKEKMDSE